MLDMYTRETPTKKDYDRWVCEDAIGWKQQVFLVTLITNWVGGLCVLAYYILFAFGLSGRSAGYSPLNLLDVIGIGIMAVSVAAHVAVDVSLTREYWNYKSPNLSKILER